MTSPCALSSFVVSSLMASLHLPSAARSSSISLGICSNVSIASLMCSLDERISSSAFGITARNCGPVCVLDMTLSAIVFASSRSISFSGIGARLSRQLELRFDDHHRGQELFPAVGFIQIVLDELVRRQSAVVEIGSC